MTVKAKRKGRARGGPVGNKKAVKLKDSAVRQEAYRQYCDHLSKGKSKLSWCFDHPSLKCTWEPLERYLKDEAEFDPFLKQKAVAEGLKYWEGVVEAAAEGTNKNVNVAALQMLMRNKYGWDKQEQSSSKEAVEEAMQKFATLSRFLLTKGKQPSELNIEPSADRTESGALLARQAVPSLDP